MEWYLLGWFLFALFIVIIYWLIVIKALGTRREIKEEYEFIGVIKFDQDTDDGCTLSDYRMLDDFDKECG